MQDKTKQYQDAIAPLVIELERRCKAAGIPFAFAAQLTAQTEQGGGLMGISTWVPPYSNEKMHTAARLLDPNWDMYAHTFNETPPAKILRQLHDLSDAGHTIIQAYIIAPLDKDSHEVDRKKKGN